MKPESQPYDLPPGFTVDQRGYLRGPAGTVGTMHIGDGLWWRGTGSMGSGVDTHPLRRTPGHPGLAFSEYACYRDNCASKGFGMRRGAFLSSLDIGFGVSERVRLLFWKAVDAGTMAPYDERSILTLVRQHVAAECDRIQAQLARVDELLRASPGTNDDA